MPEKEDIEEIKNQIGVSNYLCEVPVERHKG
jgi:hypothetical protein